MGKYDLKSIAVRYDNLEERMRIAKIFAENGMIDIHNVIAGMIENGWFAFDINDNLTKGHIDKPKNKIILTFDEFINKTPKLENNMVVEYRNGDMRIFMFDTLVGVNSFGLIEFWKYNFKHNEHRALDIIKIYRVTSFKSKFEAIFDKKNLVLIYDVEEWRLGLENKLYKRTKKQELLDKIAKLEKEIEELEE